MEDLGDEGLFRAEWDPEFRDVMNAVAESDVTVITATGSTRGWVFQLRAGSSNALSASTRVSELDRSVAPGRLVTNYLKYVPYVTAELNPLRVVSYVMKDGSESDDEIFTYDLSSRESPSDGVVAAVATATGRDAVSTADRTGPALDPLYTVVDPDALDSIVRSFERDASVLNVTFSYHDHEVTVDGDGRIVVRPLDRSVDAASD